MSNTVTNFVKLVVATIKGDDAEVIALKIQKKAVASINAQVAVKIAHTLTLEDNVENAEETMGQAQINSGRLISDTDQYILNLLRCEKDLKDQNKSLQDHLDTIDFLKDQLKSISAK